MAPAGIGAWGQRLCGLGVPSCAPHAVNLDCDVASSYQCHGTAQLIERPFKNSGWISIDV